MFTVDLIFCLSAPYESRTRSFFNWKDRSLGQIKINLWTISYRNKPLLRAKKNKVNHGPLASSAYRSPLLKWGHLRGQGYRHLFYLHSDFVHYCLMSRETFLYYKLRSLLTGITCDVRKWRKVCIMRQLCALVVVISGEMSY